jgi:hypothetical protein
MLCMCGNAMQCFMCVGMLYMSRNAVNVWECFTYEGLVGVCGNDFICGNIFHEWKCFRCVECFTCMVMLNVCGNSLCVWECFMCVGMLYMCLKALHV